MTPGWTVALVIALLLGAGCVQPAPRERDPPPILPGPSAAIAGSADGSTPGCDVELHGTAGFSMCGVNLTQAEGRFTVADIDPERPMRWSNLRLRAASANLAVVGDDPQQAEALAGDLDLGKVNAGHLEPGQSVLVCRTFDGTGPATLTFWDARPVGATVQATYIIRPCTNLPAELAGEANQVVRIPEHLEIEFDLYLGQAYAVAYVYTGNTNCVRIPDDMAPWSGEATATWNAAAPTSAELVFGADGGNKTAIRATTGHVLAIPQQRGGGFIGLSPPNPGAALEQPVHLLIKLDVIGDGSDSASRIGTSSCDVML